jgi:hypothetical protein
VVERNAKAVPAVSAAGGSIEVRGPVEGRGEGFLRDLGGGDDGTWFSVPRAAELLGVTVTKIYDGIRDGKLRVRFHADRPGASERPLVTSESLLRASGGRRGELSGSAGAGTGETAPRIDLEGLLDPSGERNAMSAKPQQIRSSESRSEPPRDTTPEPRSGPGSDPGPREAESGAPRANGTEKSGTEKNSTEQNRAETDSAARKDPAKEAISGNGELDSGQVRRAFEAEREARRAVEQALADEKSRREELAVKLEHERRSREEADRAVVAERTIRQEVERSLTEESLRRKELETSLREERKGKAEAETQLEKQISRRDELERQCRDLESRARNAESSGRGLEEELARTRTSLDQAEDRIEASLKAVYERDVGIARLEAQLNAAEQTRREGREFTERLQSRITRLEDRSEEKEKEIRRLALGLGEARGEVRLLRAPEDESVSSRALFLRRVFPWLVTGLISGLLCWFAVLFAQGQQPAAVGVLVAGGTLATFSLGLILDRIRRRR